ncbi:MAG: hypothetical protein AAGU74_08340 [Bacillota bacterium]
MAGRPSKPTDLLLLEGKSHRTKAEIETRKEAEKALVTGKHMRIWPEVKANAEARKEFNRVRALLAAIDKDDALHESTINRYALLKAECTEFEEKREAFYSNMRQMEEEHAANPRDFSAATYYDTLSRMQGSIISLDKQIMKKRQMLLAIEKENIMTIASVMRAIPKKPEEKKPSGIAAYRQKRAGD